VTCAPSSGSTFPIGDTTVTCKATDLVGNVGSSTFQVLVRDTTAPVVQAHADIVANATESGGTHITFTVSASDIVDGTLTTTCTPASGGLFPSGHTTVTCSTTDAHGNTGSITFDVYVKDAATQLTSIVEQLGALIPPPGPRPRHHWFFFFPNPLSDVLHKLTDSQRSANWVDGNHLDSRLGSRVFDDHSAAADKLEDLLRQRRPPVPVATLPSLIAQLVAVDRLLAVVAISDATAAHGDARKLAQANSELAKGDATSLQKPGDAIDHYGNAWQLVQQARRR